MCNIKPLYFNEISLYIGTRIKMIFNKNLYITDIYPTTNLKNKTFGLVIFFKFMNKKYKFIHVSILDISNIENTISMIIDEFEIIMKNINKKIN